MNFDGGVSQEVDRTLLGCDSLSQQMKTRERTKIATVVVTFNRKDLLMECLKAIEEQTFKPHTVFIVDNASTDGTKELLEVDGRYFNKSANGIFFKYIGLEHNTGGAGGFYNGMKTAYDSNENFDAVWVMDDDGLPDKDCLSNLIPYLGEYDYIAPMVLAKEDTSILAFNYNGSHDVNKVLSVDKVVPNYACPMNAILFSRNLICKVGFPIPNLFIWGDEMNYTLRCKDVGYTPVTITSAIHIHPKDRMVFAKTLFGKEITIAPSYWKEYCMIRNRVYNFKDREKYNAFRLFKHVFIYQMWYYLIRKKDLNGAICCCQAFFSGFKKNPDQGYLKWMKK